MLKTWRESDPKWFSNLISCLCHTYYEDGWETREIAAQSELDKGSRKGTPITTVGETPKARPVIKPAREKSYSGIWTVDFPQYADELRRVRSRMGR